MATTNLFSNPVFKEGAFTANDPAVRRYSIAKTLDAIDLGVELGATVYVMWGGREGAESDAAKDVRARARPLQGSRRHLLCVRARPRLRRAFRARAEAERAARRHLAADGGSRARLHRELEWPEMVGLNPEFAHETMSGLSFHHARRAGAVAGQAVPHRPQRGRCIGKFDQDFRFGSEGIRDAFYLVKLLEDAQWPGMRHFDAHAYRTEDADGVWEFARGCMRTYLILREKAERFRADPEIQAALAGAMVARASTNPRLPAPSRPTRSRDAHGPARPRRRSPSAATATNASTSSSPNSCSAPANPLTGCRASLSQKDSASATHGWGQTRAGGTGAPGTSTWVRSTQPFNSGSWCEAVVT